MKAIDIPILIIKKCCGLLCDHISKFINSFVDIEIFPDVLKRGCITPIFKKGDSLRYLDNYRPVSTLPIFSKIYEKLLYIIGYIVSLLLTILFTTSSLDSGGTIALVMQSTM